MISSLDIKYDLSEEMNASVIEDTRLTSSSQSVKLYIPNVMSGIKKGDPTISILNTNGSSVFCNGSKKPALTGQILREKNYLESTINMETNVNDLDTVVQSLSYHEKYVSYNIDKNSIVRSQFLNNKVSKLSFTVTKDTNASVIVEER